MVSEAYSLELKLLHQQMSADRAAVVRDLRAAGSAAKDTAKIFENLPMSVDKAISSMTNMARRVRRLAIDIGQFNKQVESLGNVGVSPAASQGLANKAEDLQNRLRELQEISFEKNITGSQPLLNTLQANLDKASASLKALPTDSTAAFRAFQVLTQGTRDLETSIGQLQKSADSFSKKGISKDALRRMENSVENLENRIKKLMETAQGKGIDTSDFSQGLQTQMDKLKKSLGGLPEDTSQAARSLLGLSQQSRVLATDFATLQKRIATFASEGGNQKSLDALTASLQRLDNRLLSLKENAQSKGLSSDMASAFGDLDDQSSAASGSLGKLEASSKTAIQSIMAMKGAFVAAAAAAGILLVPLKLIFSEIKKDVAVFMQMTD